MLKPGDTVVVPRIDRLARNLTEGLRTIEELHDQGINIRSLAEGLDTGDDSPTSRLMLHMLRSLAEWERDTIRDRIRAGVDHHDRSQSERRNFTRSIRGKGMARDRCDLGGGAYTLRSHRPHYSGIGLGHRRP